MKDKEEYNISDMFRIKSIPKSIKRNNTCVNCEYYCACNEESYYFKCKFLDLFITGKPDINGCGRFTPKKKYNITNILILIVDLIIFGVIISELIKHINSLKMIVIILVTAFFILFIFALIMELIIRLVYKNI